MNGTINATVNATAAATASNAPWFTSTFIPTLVDRIAVLIAAPFQHSEMIYIVTPMLITLFLMEFYFGRYTNEELGWNTAVGNAMVLVFVSVDLLKTVYPDMAPSGLLSKVMFNLSHFSSHTGDAISTLITVAIGAFGALLLITDFFHWLPKKLAFFISGGLLINITSYLGIVIVYSNQSGINPMPIDWYTFLAALFLFIALKVFFGFIHLLEPEYKGRKKDRDKIAAEAPDPFAQNTRLINREL
jgi:ascorbate-specific PTS system EIIC-type component UlaA